MAWQTTADGSKDAQWLEADLGKKQTVAGVVGAMTLLFLAQRLLFPPRQDAPPPPKALGFVLGIAGGFTSFVAHAGSPPLSAYVLPLKLEPIRLAGTMAVLFTVINLSKWIPYAWLGLFDARNLANAGGSTAITITNPVIALCR